MKFFEPAKNHIVTDPVTGEQKAVYGEKLKHEAITAVDSDQVDPHVQAQVDAVNRMQAEQQQQEAEKLQQDYEALTPTEKRIHLEKVYLPKIERLTEAHKLACDAVGDFEDGHNLFTLQECIKYAHDCKHPELRIIHCNGLYHRKHIVESGQISEGDYHQIAELTHPDRIVCAPRSVSSIMHYANSKEAQEYAESVFKRELDGLIRTRDRAAREKVACEIEAQTRWDAIKDLPTFFTKIKQASRKAA